MLGMRSLTNSAHRHATRCTRLPLAMLALFVVSLASMPPPLARVHAAAGDKDEEILDMNRDLLLVDIPVSVGSLASMRLQVREGQDAHAAVDALLTSIRSVLEPEISRAMPVNVAVHLVDGTEAELVLRGSDSIRASVAAFASTYSLPASVVSDLEAEAAQRLIDAGAAPLVELPLELNDTPTSMPIFGNEPLSFSVALFAKRHELDDATSAALEAEAGRSLSEAGVLPVAELEVSLDGGAKRPLQMFAGDSVTAAVSRFMAQERITDTDGSVTNTLAAHVAVEGRRLGIIPLAQLPVFVDSQQVAMPVFADVDASIACFARLRNVLDTAQLERLRREAVAHLRREGIAPVVELDVRLAGLGEEQGADDTKAGGGRHVHFPLYTKPDVGAQVDDFIRENMQHAGEERAAAFRVQVRQRLVDAGVVPRAVFPVVIDGDERRLELFEGKSLRDAASAFLRSNALEAEEEVLLPQLVEQLERKYGVTSVPVVIGNGEGKDGSLEEKVDFITLVHGERIEDVVSAFCRRHSLDDPYIIDQLQTGLRERLYTTPTSVS